MPKLAVPTLLPSTKTVTLCTGAAPTVSAAQPSTYRGAPFTTVALPVTSPAMSKAPISEDPTAGAVPAGALIVIERPFVAEPPALVACTVKLLVPAVVGVPVIAPLEFSDSPAGRLPETTVQDGDPVPLRVWE